jgi:crotonobetainyl-CoA:carnitine CoA-transferase CaiB-like acyl-CoA transferase
VTTYPLHNIRVLDFTRLLPGGVLSLMLADLGADVIKVESPEGGDYARQMPPYVQGQGAIFRATNRAKRSIVVNLKDSRGQAALHKMVAQADVLIEGNRPGVMARLGCDYPRLKTVNPRLVYCALSGWGQSGSYSQQSGHDLNYTAIAGLIGAMNQPQPLGGQTADIGGAYVALAGILAALFRRERTGEGGFVDTSLFEAALPYAAVQFIQAVTSDTIATNGALVGKQACYTVYRARDGQAVALAALEPKFWENFCHAAERPDLISDYLNPERQKYLLAELQELFALKTAAEWDSLLAPADCCFSRVNMPADLADDPHIRDREALSVDADSTVFIRSPLRLDDLAPAAGAVPEMGEHTEEILREFGFSDDEIADLRRSGLG